MSKDTAGLRKLISAYREEYTPPRAATQLAHDHRPADLEQAVFTSATVHTDPWGRELAACLLQELVLRGVEVESSPAMSGFAARLGTEGHPLAGLPLHLLPVEQGLRRPADASDRWTWTVPPASVTGPDTPELRPDAASRARAAGLDPAETGTTAWAEAAGAVVEHWREQSNGKVAAQEFWFPDPVRAADVPAVLERLPLLPWQDGTGQDGRAPIRTQAADPDLAVRTLLTAAVRAPAYGAGRYGAYGRLALWRSLAALTGAPADAPAEAAAPLVEQARWFLLLPGTRWFDLVAWDLAVAVLRPDGQEIAVLSATDSD
ncbi:hypothetical protein SUDANB6_00056 [Streptomyces sp. enrichment culture]|uniref:DUF6183 family protein n=1 Tax=Streptomyces sp. enrichment culture TaxID=1795815 RepID=UPI003F545601